MVNSRKKGNAFERKCCRMLEAALGVKFGRNPRSGADRRFPGDIAPVDKEISERLGYYFECKNREGWTLEQVLQGKGPVWDWWRKATREAVDHSRRPLLIFTKNRSDIYVLDWNYPFFQVDPVLRDADMKHLDCHFSYIYLWPQAEMLAFVLLPLELWCIYARVELRQETTNDT